MIIVDGAEWRDDGHSHIEAIECHLDVFFLLLLLVLLLNIVDFILDSDGPSELTNH